MCSCSLSLFYGDPLTHSSPYCSLVSTLHYLSLIRPDISFVVNKVSQFLHKPTSIHLQTVKRILHHLKFTISDGLLLCWSPSWTLQAYSDTNWASYPNYRKSIEAYAYS